MLNIQNLIDETKCYETVRERRWPAGVECTHCNSEQVTKQGRDTTQGHRQKYRCQGCGGYFDDLTGTVFAGHHQPLRVWMLGRYFRGLTPSHQQIAQELGLNNDDVRRLTKQVRQGVVTNKAPPVLSGEVEADEGYGIAGHKDQPEAVKKKAGVDAADGSERLGVGAGWRRKSPRLWG